MSVCYLFLASLRALWPLFTNGTEEGEEKQARSMTTLQTNY